MKKPNHQYSCKTITLPIDEPKNKAPMFPSKATSEGNLLNK